MGYTCNFEGCERRATRYERTPLLPLVMLELRVVNEVVSRAFCADHYGQEECPGHVASESDPKVCGRCGIHIDELRPELGDE
jgi:hypothetical protein